MITVRYLTMLYILYTQGDVFHLRSAMKTQRLANIWKAVLAPFARSNYATANNINS